MVMERWTDGFENYEKKTMFLENVIEETEGEERKIWKQLAS